MQPRNLLEQHAQKILDKTHRLCVFGSTNRQDLQGRAHNEFKKIIIAIHNILNYKMHPAIKAKLSPSEQDEINKLKKNAKQAFLPFCTISKYDLKNASTLDYLSLQEIIDSQLLKMIAKIEKGFSNWNAALLTHLHASFALYYREYCSLDNREKLERDTPAVRRYKDLESKGASTTDWEERKFYMEFLLRIGRELVAEHGFANCDPLADLALLEAFSLNLPYQITRIIFLRIIASPRGLTTDTSVDNLNVIALGNWPDPGCLIICPWLKKQFFYWKGSVENTPELQQFHLWNYAHLLFRDFNQNKERKKIQTLLVENRYSDWENLEQRTTNLQLIENYVLKFSEALRVANLKMILPAFIQNRTMWQQIPEKVADTIIDYAQEPPSNRV